MDQENAISPEDHLKNEETAEAPSNTSKAVEEAGSIPSICPWQVRCLTLKGFNTSGTHQVWKSFTFHHTPHLCLLWGCSLA